MKKIILALSLMAIFAGCAKMEEDYKGTAYNTDGLKFTSYFEDGASEGTKVYLDKEYQMHWTAKDAITVFSQSRKSKYIFDGQTGDVYGTFSHSTAEDSDISAVISKNYAVYPYDGSASIVSDGTITTKIPNLQHYRDTTFDESSNLMIAETENSVDRNLVFKNACGYLVVRIYGVGAVKKVTLKGNNGEKISGKASIAFAEGVPSLQMGDDAGTEIELVCDENVILSGDKNSAHGFWFVVPPMTFDKGFTVTITDSNDEVFERVSEKSQTITRNCVTLMPELQIGPVSNLVGVYCSGAATTRYGDRYAYGTWNWTIYNNSFSDILVKKMYIVDWADGEIEASYDVTDGTLKTWNSATYQFTVEWGMNLYEPVCVYSYEHKGKEYYAVAAYNRDIDPMTPLNVDIERAQAIMVAGDKATLDYSIKPFYLNEVKASWTSSDENVISIAESGEITAKNEGEAFAIANVGEHSDTCKVLVYKTLPEGTVNLGTSVLWASCNLGASTPTDYGDLYSWGMTEPWPTEYTFTYTSLENLPLENDAAAVVMGGHWRMPTYEEMMEMVNSVEVKEDTMNSIKVNIMTAENGNSIILPLAGIGGYNGNNRYADGGQYWYATSTPVSWGNNEYCHVYNNYYSQHTWYRSCGFSIRPVWDPNLKR